jgi:mono/diheme cytochrome c family protein
MWRCDLRRLTVTIRAAQGVRGGDVRLGTAIVIVAIACATRIHAADEAGSPPAPAVASTYRTACAPCHGNEGRGNGPAAFFIAPDRAPAPRNFTSGVYKLRSTRSGSVPTDTDLFRTINRGIPRFMPAFDSLDEALRRGLVEYIKRFSARFTAQPPQPMQIPDPPPLAADAVARGARVYTELGCPACHGEQGRGDGPAAPHLRDASGLALPAADLTRPGWFKGGDSPRDVYRTLLTGFDGTPMPGYADALGELEADAPWNLVAFIASLARN